jgi:hypothetical protein
VFRTHRIAQQMCQLGYGLMAEPRWEARRAELAAEYTIYAWLGRATREAADFMKSSTPEGWKAQRFLLAQMGASEGFVRSDVAIRSQFPKSPYIQAEKDAARLGGPERIALYREAIAEFSGSPDATMLSFAPESRIRKLEWEAAFERGEWARVPVMPGLPDWEIIAGDWRMGAPGVVEGRISPDLAPFIRWLGPVGENYEIRGEITITPQDVKKIRMAGVVLGALPHNFKNWVFFEVWNDVNKQMSTFLEQMNLKTQKPIPTAFGDSLTLHLACWEGKMWVKVDGVTIHSGVVPYPGTKSTPGRPGGLFGFGAHYNLPRTTMAFKNWETRKLTAPPTEADFPPAQSPE